MEARNEAAWRQEQADDYGVTERLVQARIRDAWEIVWPTDMQCLALARWKPDGLWTPHNASGGRERGCDPYCAGTSCRSRSGFGCSVDSSQQNPMGQSIRHIGMDEVEDAFVQWGSPGGKTGTESPTLFCHLRCDRGGACLATLLALLRGWHRARRKPHRTLRREPLHIGSGTISLFASGSCIGHLSTFPSGGHNM